MIVNKGRSILAIDLEFAQTYKKKLRKSAIMEIGMVLVRNLGLPDEEVLEYSQMCNPGVGVSFYVTKVTGITEEMIKDYPPIENFYSEIQEIIDEADVLVFHGARPDVDALINSGFRINGKEAIDTQMLAQNSLREFNGYSLSMVAETLDINCDVSHRALDDARMTLELYRELASQDNLHATTKNLIKSTI